VLAEGTSDELKDRVGGERLEIPSSARSSRRRRCARSSPTSDEPVSAEAAPWSRSAVRQRSGAIVDAVERLVAAGVGVDDISLHRPTLDDVFLALTGHAAEGDGSDPEAGS
jgi:ABC-2 type transport system ATP-binding protein